MMKNDNNVEVIRKLNGRPARIRITDLVFTVRDDLPEGLDPVEVANNFFQTFDIFDTTALSRSAKRHLKVAKVFENSDLNLEIWHDKEGRRIVGSGHERTIYYDIIADMYHKFGKKPFKSVDLHPFLKKSGAGAMDAAARAYLRFLQKIECIKIAEPNKGSKAATYEFIVSPVELLNHGKPSVESSDRAPAVADGDEILANIRTSAITKSTVAHLYKKLGNVKFTASDLSRFIPIAHGLRSYDTARNYIKFLKLTGCIEEIRTKDHGVSAIYIFVESPLDKELKVDLKPLPEVGFSAAIDPVILSFDEFAIGLYDKFKDISFDKDDLHAYMKEGNIKLETEMTIQAIIKQLRNSLGLIRPTEHTPKTVKYGFVKAPEIPKQTPPFNQGDLLEQRGLELKTSRDGYDQ